MQALRELSDRVFRGEGFSTRADGDCFARQGEATYTVHKGAVYERAMAMGPLRGFICWRKRRQAVGHAGANSPSTFTGVVSTEGTLIVRMVVTLRGVAIEDSLGCFLNRRSLRPLEEWNGDSGVWSS
jgi:hypothetical protein